MATENRQKNDSRDVVKPAHCRPSNPFRLITERRQVLSPAKRLQQRLPLQLLKWSARYQDDARKHLAKGTVL